jgi:iron(III) transport system substrate-binding protein
MAGPEDSTVNAARPTTPGRGMLRRTLPLLLLLLVLSLVAAACGGGGSATPEGTEAPTGAPTSEPTEPAAATDDAAATPTEAATEAAGADAEGPLTIYSGRSEELVGPLMEQFTAATGIEVEVRYGDTAELAATILEEGQNSPADVYFGQDAGALGALASEGILAPLPEAELDRVAERFRASDGTWVGVSGRSRVIAYNTDTLSEEEVPDSVLDLTDEAWNGRVGWAPSNGSFQAFVTAMRVELGDDAAQQWLEDMVANGAQVYEKNTAIVEAVGRGEIDLGLVNHYYLYQYNQEDPSFPVANAFLEGGDVGALVNVAGAGVLTTTDQQSAAEEFVAFLLSTEGQEYFREETFEYPLVEGIPADESLPELTSIETPELDLGDIDDLQGTLELLRVSGALQ